MPNRVRISPWSMRLRILPSSLEAGHRATSAGAQGLGTCPEAMVMYSTAAMSWTTRTPMAMRP